jgi:hypothetical protein
MFKKFQRECDECFSIYTAKKDTSKFCCTKCRKTFNNRRAQRGALLYDALMAVRYDREAATQAGIDWNFICRIGELYHGQDLREGRRHGTHRSPRDVKDDFGCQVNARSGRI